jgi:hypothetical protein
MTALELYGGSESDQQAEAALNALQGVVDLILLPIDAVFLHQPWHRRASPDVAYDRWRHREGPAPEPNPPPPGPFNTPAPVSVTP